jgi:hemerythrin-like metal-binding protein
LTRDESALKPFDRANLPSVGGFRGDAGDGPDLASSWLKAWRSSAWRCIMKRTDGCALRIPELDEQHKLVFERFVLVKESMAKGRGWNEMHLALATLIKSFEFCAAVEEALMRIHGFPGGERHKREHVELLESLHELERANLTTGVTEKMIGSTFASTMKHHLTQDRGYARYLPQLRRQAQ